MVKHLALLVVIFCATWCFAQQDFVGPLGGTITIPALASPFGFGLQYNTQPHGPLVGIEFDYDYEGDFDALMVRLGESGPTYTFLPDSLNPTHVHAAFYDFAYMGGDVVGALPLTQAWRDELADNEFIGAFWVSGAQTSPTELGIFTSSAYFLVPEPATLTLLLPGLAMLDLRRRCRAA